MMKGCEGKRQAANDDFITVDVTKSYFQKKGLILQDFMDVEYVVLETSDDFLCQGLVDDIGEDFIIVRNNIPDGNIFVFDRKGQAIRKINRAGQGPEEYSRYCIFGGIRLDEDNNEMFVNNSACGSIIVYDLSGNFKRKLKHDKSVGILHNSSIATPFYEKIFNYDRDNLICYLHFTDKITFVIISKQDGSITKVIDVPFKEKLLLRHRDATANPGFPIHEIIPNNNNWLLSEISSDTIYTFLPDYSLQPFIVRTPSIQSMDPEVALILRLVSDRYFFMETIKNEFNFNTGRGFTRTFMMYDTREKAFFGYVVYNGDYSTKKEIYMNVLRPVNHEIESWQPIEAYQLVESYKKEELKDGKLKDIAATLDAEDNAVIMLIKHQK